MKKRKPNPSISIEGDASNLPCDVVYNILSRLPVKSLFRFRCVSKPWLNLISQPQFAKHQLHQSTHLDRQRFFISVDNSNDFYSIDYTSSNWSVEKLHLPIKNFGRAEVLGSCNGLLLLGHYCYKYFVLWNPSTGSYIKCSWSSSGFSNNCRIGLCYDSYSDDYKVVFSCDDSSVVVFSVKTHCWKLISEIPYCVYYGDFGVTVNGALHWIMGVRGDCDCRSPVIAYFDFGEERFKEVPQPNNFENPLVLMMSVIGGCLCLYQQTYGTRVELWTMKEHGVKESWTRLIINLPSSWQSTSRFFVFPNLLCFTKKGEVLAWRKTDDKFLIYNPKEKKSINVFKLQRSRGWTTATYVDSLVLPTREKMTTRQTHQK